MVATDAAADAAEEWKNGLPLPHRHRCARSASASGSRPCSMPSGAAGAAPAVAAAESHRGPFPKRVCERPEPGVPVTRRSALPPVMARSTRREAAAA